MRRIDVLAIGLAIFLAGGLGYIFLRAVGVESLSAGIWSQAVLVLGLLGWVLTYVVRAVGGNLTYNQQRDAYETAFLQKRLDELSPEELAALTADLESDSDSEQSS